MQNRGGKSEHPLTLSEKRIAANSRAFSERSERDGKCNRKYTAPQYCGVRVKSCGPPSRRDKFASADEQERTTGESNFSGLKTPTRCKAVPLVLRTGNSKLEYRNSKRFPNNFRNSKFSARGGSAFGGKCSKLFGICILIIRICFGFRI